MGHTWGDLPGEGPIARRLRLQRAESTGECGKCGRGVVTGEAFIGCVHREDEPPTWMLLCRDCGLQLGRWMYGQG